MDTVFKDNSFGFCLHLVGHIKCERGKGRGDDMQQMASGWNWTCGHCGKDNAFVHGTLNITSELLGAPEHGYFVKNTPDEDKQVMQLVLFINPIAPCTNTNIFPFQNSWAQLIVHMCMQCGVWAATHAKPFTTWKMHSRAVGITLCLLSRRQVAPDVVKWP